jgi:hypothetical protein
LVDTRAQLTTNPIAVANSGRGKRGVGTVDDAARDADAIPCRLTWPCRLLPAARNSVADGGNIWMQGSANCNTETAAIGKSVSILAVPGVVGSIVVQKPRSGHLDHRYRPAVRAAQQRDRPGGRGQCR